MPRRRALVGCVVALVVAIAGAMLWVRHEFETQFKEEKYAHALPTREDLDLCARFRIVPPPSAKLVGFCTRQGWDGGWGALAFEMPAADLAGFLRTSPASGGTLTAVTLPRDVLHPSMAEPDVRFLRATAPWWDLAEAEALDEVETTYSVDDGHVRAHVRISVRRYEGSIVTTYVMFAWGN